jgi:transcription elongation factor Elf1
VEKAKKIHGDLYDYSESVYVSMDSKIKILCRTHGEFIISPNHHINSKQGCRNCKILKKRKASTETFLKKAKEIHGELYSYHKNEYITYQSKLIATCKKHGDFKTRISNHIFNKAGCLLCSREIQKAAQTFTTKWFIQKANEVHKNKYFYEKTNYVNSGIKVSVTCPKHGDFEVIPDNFLNKKSGCPMCAHEANTSNTEEFIKKAKNIHPNNEYDYSATVYTKSTNMVLIKCNNCKKSFNQRARMHLSGYGCQHCGKRYKISKPEKKWLDSNGVLEEYRQYEILINKISHQKIFADGFDPKTNTVYEFLGDFWHGNLKIYPPDKINPKTGTTFKDLNAKTLKRIEILKKLGYNVVYIWESDYNLQKKKLKYLSE